MPMYYHNETLFSEIYLEEITRQTENADVLASLKVLGEYREYADTHNLQSWKESYVHEVLSALGFFAHSKDQSLTYLFPMGNTGTENPLSLCYVVLPDESLDNTTIGSNWAEKIIRALRENNLPWGLLTNGKQWRIYHQEEPTPYETYLEIDLEAILADNAKEAYQIFHKFMKAENFVVHEDGNGQKRTFACQFDRFKKESQDKIDYIEKELANALKQREEGGKGVLSDLCMGYVEELRRRKEGDLDDEGLRKKIYHGAMLYMFRLLFLFYADARRLLSDENHDLLLKVENECRTRHDGDASSDLTLPIWDSLEHIFVDIDQTYNGGLFSPQESEFTRFLSDTRIGDAYLSNVIFNLTTYHERNGQEKPISYRDMSVRHLGTLYEGLLEHKLFIANEDTEVKVAKGKIQFIPASQGGKLVVGHYIKTGEVYFAGDPSERKSTGSYYTPEYIVDYIVRNTVGEKLKQLKTDFLQEQRPTLEAYHRAMDDDERHALAVLLEENTLAFVREQMLELSVLDPAMGSGHFLVNATNLISNFFTEIFNEIGIQGSLESSTEYWRRWVVENCIYGVDLNPLAVELAKLSIWILSMAKDQPLSFLNHHLKCGNSLVGAKLEEIGNHPFSTVKKEPRQLHLFERDSDFKAAVEAVILKSRQIAGKASASLDDVREKKVWLEEIDQILEGYKTICDVHTSLYFGNNIEEAKYVSMVQKKDFNLASSVTVQNNYLHWELDFPQVFFSKHGFDVVIGNPPYGAAFKPFEVSYLINSYATSSNQPESYLLFYEKATLLTKFNGYIGMIIPNTWLTNLNANPFRSYIIGKLKIATLSHYTYQVFPSATISVQNIICLNVLPSNTHEITIDIIGKDVSEHYSINQSRWQSQKGEAINIFEHPNFNVLADKLRLLPKLGDLCDITQGAKPFQIGKGKPAQTKQILEEKPFVSEIKKDDTFRPLLRGSLMGRYKVTWNYNYWISLGDWLAEPRYSANYDAREKIVIRQTGDSLVATLDAKQFVIRDNLYAIHSKNNTWDLRYFLGIINSKLLCWYYQKILNPETNEPLAQVKRVHLTQLPIVDPGFVINNKIDQYKLILQKVNQILSLHEQMVLTDNELIAAQIRDEEFILDSIVCDLYELTDQEKALVLGHIS